MFAASSSGFDRSRLISTGVTAPSSRPGPAPVPDQRRLAGRVLALDKPAFAVLGERAPMFDLGQSLGKGRAQVVLLDLGAA
jgi:hypothetical protein